MTDAQTLDAYGALIEPATLKIQRLLPGPIERVWAYLTESELRRQWLAAGSMELKPGAVVELVWRNEELSDPPSLRPEGMPVESRRQVRIVAVDPPRRLVMDWQDAGEVSIELAPQGDEVLLTLIHSRLPDRGMTLSVSGGWHAHLDVLAARARGKAPAPFWTEWTRLREEYQRRLPG